LDGSELFTITGIENITLRQTLQVKAVKADGREIRFAVTARLDTDIDIDYYTHGGIMPYVLRKIAAAK
jgi:aconitate hydratase